MPSSFIAYIDESGDEGMKFRTKTTSGSTLWFSLSAVVVRRSNEPHVVTLIDDVRRELGKDPRAVLHFRRLNHSQKLMFTQRIAGNTALRVVTVLAYKPSLVGSTLFQDSRLYFYVTRILLERISWLCRDADRRFDGGDGTCEVIFSNRSSLSYDDLRGYLSMLRQRSTELDCRIDWSVINPSDVASLHPQWRGLQLADAAASGFFFAVEPDQYGNIEDRYVKTLLTRCYRYKGTKLNRYGVKICCGNKQSETEIENSISWLS